MDLKKKNNNLIFFDKSLGVKNILDFFFNKNEGGSCRIFLKMYRNNIEFLKYSVS